MKLYLEPEIDTIFKCQTTISLRQAAPFELGTIFLTFWLRVLANGSVYLLAVSRTKRLLRASQFFCFCLRYFSQYFSQYQARSLAESTKRIPEIVFNS